MGRNLELWYEYIEHDLVSYITIFLNDTPKKTQRSNIKKITYELQMIVWR